MFFMLPLRTHVGALGSNLWSFLPGLACKENIEILTAEKEG